MKWSTFGIVLAVVAFLAAFLIYPLWYVFEAAFFPGDDGTFSLSFFRVYFQEDAAIAALVNSFKMAVTTTFFSVLLALPLAQAAVRYKFPGKGFVTGLLLVPMIMPPSKLPDFPRGMMGVRSLSKCRQFTPSRL